MDLFEKTWLGRYWLKLFMNETTFLIIIAAVILFLLVILRIKKYKR